mmetsp:Transcript_40425/g.72867  ORF Transcript_40425/g.72867 Transcript_40425/m.72867 type:complete len:324 (-) Transcript_40425:151-1122(-)
MVCYYFRPIIATYAAFLAVCTPQLATSQQYEASRTHRGLDIEVTNSDEYATSVLTIQAPELSLGIGPDDHAKITAVLAETRELVETANILVGDPRTLKAGQDMMEKADAMFAEVKDHIRYINDNLLQEETEQRALLRKKYSDHDVQKALGDDERSLDVTRNMYETRITFPECVERLYDDCLDLVNEDLASIGLTTIEVVTHEKRNGNQDGYFKVVIVTNELDDRVVGRDGDGIVQYPFQWKDKELGSRFLGVGADGTWNCLNMTPEACCNTIQESVPNPDNKGNNIACHIFVPFGGVGNKRRSDRVFINLSPDGRVQEPPIIS